MISIYLALCRFIDVAIFGLRENPEVKDGTEANNKSEHVYPMNRQDIHDAKVLSKKYTFYLFC